MPGASVNIAAVNLPFDCFVFQLKGEVLRILHGG